MPPLSERDAPEPVIPWTAASGHPLSERRRAGQGSVDATTTLLSTVNYPLAETDTTHTAPAIRGWVQIQDGSRVDAIGYHHRPHDSRAIAGGASRKDHQHRNQLSSHESNSLPNRRGVIGELPPLGRSPSSSGPDANAASTFRSTLAM